MRTENGAAQDSRQWDSIMFIVAGSFMSVNAVSLWVMNYSNSQISLLWVAIPGIAALTASIIGLFKLYPRISSKAPWLARSGAGFALIAGFALCLAAIWIFGIAIFVGEISEHIPGGVLALTGVFIVSMVIAFICYAIAFLKNNFSQAIGYLLIVPIASWGIMLVVGMIESLEVGLINECTCKDKKFFSGPN